MDKIIRPALEEIPSLEKLAKNHEQWGKEFEENLKKGGKSKKFQWKGDIYSELRLQLSLLTSEHCSFCDGYPIGETSTETIEHYYPKHEYPLKSYLWENLFYCCNRCQSEANRQLFIETLKPDLINYAFDDYFYFDLGSYKINVWENLQTEKPEEFLRATNFLLRYGINDNKRISARRSAYYDIVNHFVAKNLTIDKRERIDFPYRSVYDHYVVLNRL